MSYGPTTVPSRSPLAYDETGKPVVFWDCGLLAGKITTAPKFDVVMDLPGGGTARASFPSRKQRLLVDDPGKERVVEHWAVAKTRWLARPVVGVHVFTEERGDGFVGVEVIVNAGTLDPAKPNSWPGAVRFNDIRVVLPSGWSRKGGTFGPPGDWYVGPRGMMTRRFALLPTNANAAVQANASAWLALAGLVANGHPCLGAGRHKIPLAKAYRHQPLQGGKGAGPISTDRPSDGGGMVSGYGIIPLGGWEGSAGAARSYANDVWRVLSGHPCAAFHVATGEPILPSQWANPRGYPLTDGYLGYDYWNKQDLAGSLVGVFGWDKNAPWPKEFNPGPSNSRAAILAIQKHDGAHLIRALHVLIAAWYYTRSWSAWLELRMIAIDVATSGVLLGSNQYLRERAWTQKAIATGIAIQGPGAERTYLLTHRDAALAQLSMSILPNGWARAGAYPNSDNGEPWAMGMPTEYATAAAWQLGLYVDGTYDLLRCGPLTAITKPRADWLLTEALASMIVGPLTQNGSPPVHAGVIKSGKAEVPVVRGVGRAHDGHSIHEWHAIALAWKWTGDVKFRYMLERIGTPARNLTQLQAHWLGPNDQAPEWSCVPKAVIV